MFFDHVEIDSLDFERATKMYSAVLPSVFECDVSTSDSEVIFYIDDVSFFLIRNSSDKANIHIAFRLPTIEKVKSAYTLAMQSGFSDNGPPGYRTAYAPDYYASFVLDGDGNNIEFICRTQSGQ